MDINFVGVTFTVRLPLALAELLTRDCEDGVTLPIDVIESALREYHQRRGLLNPQSK
jgi:hypothetical protein